MQLTITPLAEAGVELAPPDIVWNGTTGDFALVTDPAQGGAGGLQGQHPIISALVMLLFTDGRAEKRELRFEHGGDRRGWAGDGIKLFPGDRPFPGKLWLDRRDELTDAKAAESAARAREAVQPLLDDRLVSRIDVRPELLKAQGLYEFAIDVYGRDGRKIYAAQFDVLWRTATPY